RAEHAGELLRLHLTEVDVVDHREAPLLHEEAARALQRAHAHAARGTVAPVLGLGGMGATAADVDGRSNRGVTSPAGALLLVQLLARALDRGALLACSSARAAGGELGVDHV